MMAPSASEDSLRAARLLGRASFGARPGDAAAMAAMGPAAWLERQLVPAAIDEAGIDARLAGIDAGDPEPMVLPRGAGRGKLDPEQRRMLAARARIAAQAACAGRVVRAVHAERQLLEIMVDFWLNHFSVFARKGVVWAALSAYEHQAIRPHALGRFEDLLLAVARSPAMLLYLDAVRSRARGRLRGGGINENYARELLELHTLGVDGGYTQGDVIEVAHVLTGWSVTRELPPDFRFRRFLHDGGRRRVLGAELRERGEAQGVELLRILARHPATARFIAGKLARRFVADTPPPALVERLARRFLDTGGDIAQVLRALFWSPEFADPEQRKLKTPLRWLASGLRATGGETGGGERARFVLAVLGELPLFARTPEGYPDVAAAWMDPSAMLTRMSVAFGLAQGVLDDTRAGLHVPPLDEPARREIASLAPGERVALALASPEFQWH